MFLFFLRVGLKETAFKSEAELYEFSEERLSFVG